MDPAHAAKIGPNQRFKNQINKNHNTKNKRSQNIIELSNHNIGMVVII